MQAITGSNPEINFTPSVARCCAIKPLGRYEADNFLPYEMKNSLVVISTIASALFCSAGHAQSPSAIESNRRAWIQLKDEMNRMNRDFSQSVKLFSVAVEMAPTFPEPINGLACISMANGDVDGAIEKFTRSIQTKPTIYAYFFRGFLLAKKHDFGKAKLDFDAISRVRPELRLAGYYQIEEANGNTSATEKILRKYSSITGSAYIVSPGCSNVEAYEK